MVTEVDGRGLVTVSMCILNAANAAHLYGHHVDDAEGM